MSEPLPVLAAALADRYAFEHELGRGGMATVYLAQDRKHGRGVAIKVLHPEIASLLGTDRFLREIRIAAGLTHPNILPLIDSGEAGGQLYYVTPHVPGGSLRDRLQQTGRMPIADVTRILGEVGAALDYANRQGIVHRDVKPENILFADGHAVLADFGIARALRAAGTRGITEAGMVLGTPEYMSPEQAAGEQELSIATDIYSLACVTYELLAGTPPLVGVGPRATITKQITETPLPVRTARPEVPAAMARVLARALAKEPGDRFGTVGEFVAAFEAGGTAGASAPSQMRRAIAVLPLVNASADPANEYLSDGITDELIDALAKVDGLAVASRTSVFALKGTARDVRSIGALLDAAWVLEGTVRRSGQRLRVTAQLSSTDEGRLLWSERFDRTFEDVFVIQEEIARTIVETLRANSLAELVEPVARRRTSSVEAYGLYLKGRYAWNKRTQDGVTEAIAYFEQAIAEDPAYAQAYTGLSDSYALQLDYRSVPVSEGFARAEAYARKAIALDETVAEGHASLAWSIFVYDWNWAEAGREFRRAIELNPHYATARQWFAFWLAAHGRHDEARSEIHRAAELDPSSVSIRRAIGWIYYYARRYDDSRRYLERAVAMNPTADETYRVLALTYAMQGAWAEAEGAAREATLLSAGGTYNRATLAYVLARAGQRAEAERELAGLQALAAADYVSPVAFATAYLGLEDWEKAFEWAERAYEDRRGWLAYLRVNPIVDPLRGRARFDALLQRLELA